MKYADWKIQVKLIVIMVGIGLVVAGVIAGISINSARKTINENMQTHYDSIRDIRAEQLTNWYGEREGDITVLALLSDVVGQTKTMLAYGDNQGVKPSEAFPVEGAAYEDVYSSRHQEVLHEYVAAYGYYDLFLISMDGHVMWTDFREPDLGANVASGSLASEGLGLAFAAAMQSDSVALTDTAKYSPSKGAPAQFIAKKIRDPETGEALGVVCLQIPQTGIDGIVQSDFGMGKTGESYLIGKDLLMRSNSRLVQQDTGEDTVLKQKCDQDYVQAGLDGEQDFKLNAKDYDGVPALTSYGFVDLPGGLRWAIVSEIYKSEAYESLNKMTMGIIISALVMVVIVVIVAFFVGRSIGNPLTALAAAARTMAKGDFTVELKDTNVKDEIGQMTQAFLGMKENTRGLIETVAKAATNVASSSEELAAGADETGKAVQEVATTVGEMAKGSQNAVANTSTAAENLSENARAIEGISKDIEEVAAYATQAAAQGAEGKKNADDAAEIISRAAESVRETTRVVHLLGEKTNQIGEFIGIITGIADQTNLLALNAAIEAARAGDAGRGFAVVAEEVRKLAEESNGAAGNITSLVKGIETEMQNALAAMERSDKEVSEGSTTVNQASQMLEEIVHGVEALNDKVQNISAAAEQINASTGEVVSAITAVASEAEEAAASAEEVSASTEEQTASMEEISANASNLATLAQGLQEEISKFKV